MKMQMKMKIMFTYYNNVYTISSIILYYTH